MCARPKDARGCCSECLRVLASACSTCICRIWRLRRIRPAAIASSRCQKRGIKVVPFHSHFYWRAQYQAEKLLNARSDAFCCVADYFPFFFFFGRLRCAAEKDPQRRSALSEQLQNDVCDLTKQVSNGRKEGSAKSVSSAKRAPSEYQASTKQVKRLVTIRSKKNKQKAMW